jgi:hypothetical protein
MPRETGRRGAVRTSDLIRRPGSRFSSHQADVRSRAVFRFEIVDSERSLGVYALAREDWKSGDSLLDDAGRTLRVVSVISPEPGQEDSQLPLLVVEQAGGTRP